MFSMNTQHFDLLFPNPKCILWDKCRYGSPVPVPTFIYANEWGKQKRPTLGASALQWKKISEQ